MKKDHVWRATTAGLFLGQLNQSTQLQLDEELTEWNVDVGNKIHSGAHSSILRKAEKTYVNSYPRCHQPGVKVDKEISKQVASITWIFSAADNTQGPRNEQGADGGEWYLVKYPGVTKRGKSNGDGFDSMTVF